MPSYSAQDPAVQSAIPGCQGLAWLNPCNLESLWVADLGYEGVSRTDDTSCSTQLIDVISICRYAYALKVFTRKGS